MSFDLSGADGAPILAGLGGERRSGALGVIRVAEETPFTPPAPSFGARAAPPLHGASAMRRDFEHWRDDLERWRRTLAIDHCPKNSESLPLMVTRNGTNKPCHGEERCDLMRTTVLLSGLVLWLVVLGMMGYGFHVVSSNLSAIAEAITPSVAEMTNHTMAILANGDAASMHVRNTLRSGEIMSDTALPQMLQALNATQAVVDRLERLAKHPTVQLSLGGS